MINQRSKKQIKKQFFFLISKKKKQLTCSLHCDNESLSRVANSWESIGSFNSTRTPPCKSSTALGNPAPFSDMASFATANELVETDLGLMKTGILFLGSEETRETVYMRLLYHLV